MYKGRRLNRGRCWGFLVLISYSRNQILILILLTLYLFSLVLLLLFSGCIDMNFVESVFCSHGT